MGCKNTQNTGLEPTSASHIKSATRSLEENV